MGTRIPMVDYLVLEAGDEHLVSRCCTKCQALYFDRRNACAHCGGRECAPRRLSNDGSLRAFTIVHRAAPGVPTPYVSAVVDLDGGGVVKANLLNVEPAPAIVQFGMPVRLTT